MSEKWHNNNSDNPLTSRRSDGGKNVAKTDDDYYLLALTFVFFRYTKYLVRTIE